MATDLDGSEGAPAGAAEFPTLLSGYATRPAWEVAAVDYHVGMPDGEVLKAPAAIAMSGVQVNSNSHVITVSANNVTLDGYDFSGNGGWQVNLTNGATNLTVKNSYFKVGANNLIPVQAAYGGAVSLFNNTFDGGGASRSVNAMFFAGSGATVEYNRFTNFPDDGIDITRNGDFTVKYNDFDTMNLNGPYHTDAIQTYFSAIKSLDVEYNTMYQPPNEGEYNSFIRIGDERGNTVDTPIMAYNTIVTEATGTGGAANVFQVGADDGDDGSTLLDPTIHDNYVDPSGTMYAVVSPELFSATDPIVYNNVNMTGSPSTRLLVGPANSWSSGVPDAPPAAPTISADALVNGGQHALSGSAPPGTTVDIFNADTLLGTTEAGSSGAWSYTTASLGAVTPALSARATDQYGNASAPSAVVGTGGSPGGGTTPPGGGGTGSGGTPESLFSTASLPTLAADPDPNPVELGVKFSSDTTGTVTAISYYKSAADTGTHTGTLFSSTGTVLATGTFTNETASGWQTLTFSKPVSIAAGATYVAAFHSNGHYATTVDGFSAPFARGDLAAPVNAGVYSYGASGSFPTQTYEATNYHVSVDFVPAGSSTASANGGSTPAGAFAATDASGAAVLLDQPAASRPEPASYPSASLTDMMATPSTMASPAGAASHGAGAADIATGMPAAALALTSHAQASPFALSPGNASQLLTGTHG